MRILKFAAAAAVLAPLCAGCAGSVSAPVAMQAMPAEQKAALRIGGISTDADASLKTSEGEFGFIAQKVHAYIDAEKPGVIVDGAPGALHMKIHFTTFDRGDTLARGMLMGMGQIRIEATVSLVDASGATVASNKIAKDFALGGVIGATTTVDDVENGFAKSVAEIVK
jgi:hypothetical protein